MPGKYHVFIDESGTASPTNYKDSPVFTLSAFVTNERGRERLNDNLGRLKQKYFGRRSYYLHAKDVRWWLQQRNKSLTDFSKELTTVMNSIYFFLLFSCVDKEKAFRKGWGKEAIYKKSYTVLVSNMLKFFVARNIKGNIVAEASNIEQDMYLYNSFFHFIANGIDRLSITPDIAKNHLTSLSFVTKLNNDVEEQMADMYGMYGKIRLQIDKKERDEASLDPLEYAVYKTAGKKLFNGGANCNDHKRNKLYKEINSFIKLPK